MEIKNSISKLLFAFSLLVFVFVSGNSAAQEIPEPMNPPRMVNDFAGMLGNNEVQQLESKLQEFYFQSSTQIYIVSVEDLQGYPPAEYAVWLGEKWQVGTKDKDNGIVILVKPKTSGSDGQVYISVGYGLEGVIPDITAKRVVSNDIIPAFREGNIYMGLNQGTNTLIELARGEYTADEYMGKTEGSGGFSIGGIIFIILLIITIFGGGSRSNRNRSIGRSLPFWLLLSMMNSGSRAHGGSWGGFSGGSGGFGGGFGGGGGGSFGGGGAGGSW